MSVTSAVLSAIEQFLRKNNEELIQCTALKMAGGGGKKDKAEDRFVALAKPCKLYTFVNAPKFKIVTTNHILDLLEVRSSNLKELCFKFKTGVVSGESDYPDDFLNALVGEVERSFPGMGRTLFALAVQPPDRIVEQSMVNPDEIECGGFGSIYSAFASYIGVSPRPDILWHVENVSHKQSSKTLDLREFEGLTFHDLQALFMALKSNTYFTSLVVGDLVGTGKYEKNSPHIDSLMEIFFLNTTLVSLDLRGCVPKAAAGDIWPALFNALVSNKKCAITSLDVSDNVFDASGINAFAHWLQTMPAGLTELHVSNCGLDKKALVPLCNALKAHPKVRSSLSVLDMSCNKWDADSVSALAGLFASTTNIYELNLHDTQAPLDSLLTALIRGCLELRILDISSSHVTQRGASQLCQWVKASSQLKRINVSQTEMPPESLAELITSIGSNCYLTDVVLKASQLRVGPTHATQIALAVGKAPNIASLDVAGNELGEDGVAALCASIVGLGAQCAMKRLVLSGNLSSASKEKDARRNNPKASSAIIALLSSDVPLESLSLRGGRAPAVQPSPNDCIDIIYSLACKEAKLQDLDLMSCGMGNRGAVALGQMLQVNKSLRKLTWDHNNVTISGYRAFVKGLERNRTLKVMPLPVKDIEAALIANPSPDANAVIQSMHTAIANIQGSQKFESAVKFGSTGIITQDGRQDILDKEVAKLRRLASQCEPDPDVQTLIEDCSRVQQMGPSFQLMREEVSGLLEHEMILKLQALSKEFSTVVAQMKSQLASKMGEYISQTFKSIESDDAKRLRVVIDYTTKAFDHVSLDKILVDAAGMEIESGASECFSSAVDRGLDFVYDKLTESLKSSIVNLESIQATQNLDASDSNVGLGLSRSSSVMTLSQSGGSSLSHSSSALSLSHHDKKEKKKEEKEKKKEEKEKKKEEKEKKKEEKKKKKEEKEEEKKEEKKEEEPAPMVPARRAPPVPAGGAKKPPGRLGANNALAAALAAGPQSPASRKPPPRIVEEAPVAAAEVPKAGKKEKLSTPVVKPTKTREITYDVAAGETVLGVAVENNTETTPALTHPTKGRARGPAGRKGGARRPPTHKDYTLTDPTAQLQPTML